MVWQPSHELQGGKYIIEEILGEEGFEITYKVWHHNLQTYTVIKTINDDLRDDPDYQKYEEKFQQEARILQRLSQQENNHIVSIKDLFVENNICCLMMDFVEGESLEDLVKNRKLSKAEVVNCIQQIAQALIVIHSLGLVHGNVHPGNIIFQNDGTATLIDFGIAGEIIPTSRYKSSKKFAHQVFAPYEQSLGRREPTIDIYSLASSLYFAATGELPVSGNERYTDVILHHNSDPLVPPEAYNYSLSNNVKFAIEKGMKIEPEYRSQSVSNWLELLLTDVVVKVSDFPWLSLGYITFYYSIFGFLLGLSTITITCAITYAIASSFGGTLAIILLPLFSTLIDPSMGMSMIAFYITEFFAFTIAIASALPIGRAYTVSSIYCLFINILLGVENDRSAVLTCILTWILCILFIFTYNCVDKQLKKQSIREDNQEFILAGASLLGVFLGWLVYQLFPQLYLNI
ncbi:MAG: protein kinase [Sphaerospermopsis sp. SIO1G1]|nr:protein kinase [Sphaerospermopsis sp. SIO1G1]